MERRVTEALRASFKPEFLNRIDETIIFLNLEPDQIGRIVDIQMARLSDRLADQNIELVLSDSARDLIARQGYDPCLRRPAIEAGDPTADRKPAGHGDPGRKHSGRCQAHCRSGRGADRFQAGVKFLVPTRKNAWGSRILWESVHLYQPRRDMRFDPSRDQTTADHQ
jgi:hypothetical protein